MSSAGLSSDAQQVLSVLIVVVNAVFTLMVLGFLMKAHREKHAANLSAENPVLKAGRRGNFRDQDDKRASLHESDVLRVSGCDQWW